jgi:predicted transcriptional regulator
MSLFEVLRDRAAINILKVLYDNSQQSKSKHTMLFTDIVKKIPFKVPTKAIFILTKHKLIQSDILEKEYIISLSSKGKEFIQILDELKEILVDKKEKKHNAHINYSLTESEKRILVMIKRISNEIGPNNITLKNLTIELFPHEVYEKKSRLVTRYITKLQQLKLVERSRKGRESAIKLTESGERTIKNQFLMGIAR